MNVHTSLLSYFDTNFVTPAAETDKVPWPCRRRQSFAAGRRPPDTAAMAWGQCSRRAQHLVKLCQI